jgi:PilZ domain-containing protein
MPVQIYDLSLGGCFVNSMHDSPPVGRVFKMTLDLPGEDGLVLRAETVYSRPGFGYAVRFIELSEETTASLTRAMERSLRDREE